ncbi:hypothetical protein [Marimonas arenosa]|uniref:Uncharacterized protein n=1 Tax=Marimonas arenosa TaxID=1795305 RepID=A0AAE3WD56_9RHOB|nr:hypothetical protein [Marimonas arenosa]MDQ2090285.1 hypothetical protein [Marimonas arenosa]
MSKANPFRKITFPLIAAGLIGVAPVARAEMAIMSKQPTAGLVKSVAGSGTARHDWLAKRSAVGSTKNSRVVQRVSLGRGSWICSPAGFNRKSRCYRR